MNNKNNLSKKNKIHTYFIIWTCISLISSFGIVLIILFILHLNMDLLNLIKTHSAIVVFLLLITPLLIGALMTIILGNPILKIMEDISFVLNEISNGNFKARLKPTKVLKDFNHNFNKMVSELDSVEILRSDFVNNFSHELKTPIVSIKGFAEELKRKDLTEEERQKYLEIIVNESNRLTELSTNILNLSKIEKQEIVTNKRKVNIGEQIRKVILMEMKKIEQKELHLELDIKDYYALVNEDLMEQVWINLIENAIRYSKENGTISIQISKNNEEIVVKIKDNGIGIAQEHLPHIFDKFYKVDHFVTSRGNGLGLTLTKKIIDLHKGRIEVTSKIGKGTEFTVLLKNI